MKFTERAFSAKSFRPRPGCYVSASQKFSAVITPWGQGELSTEQVFEELESQYSILSEDAESTRLSPVLQSLSQAENDIRTAVMSVNQNIYNKVNEEDYSTGFELFALSRQDSVCSFSQIGCPIVLLDRPHQPLCLIGSAPAEAGRQNSKTFSPLPVQLMGLHEDAPLSFTSFPCQKGDRLILLSRAYVPPAWFAVKKDQRKLKHLSKLAVQDNPLMPFWLGLLDLDS